MSPPTESSAKEHWQQAYRERGADEVSWYEERPELSLSLIEEAGIGRDAAIVDVGGGASRLAAELLAKGHTDLSVVDLSAEALAEARRALGSDASRVEWIEADVRSGPLPRRYELWHDRAVFHFMHEREDRDAYLATLGASLRPGGHAVIATFGPEGPERCSGLAVRRYGPDELLAALGEGFALKRSELHVHHTPSGSAQQFHYALLRRTG